MAEVIRLVEKKSGRTVRTIMDGRRCTVGRSKGLAVVLHNLYVSKTHADVYYCTVHRCVVLEDLASKNGTFVNGERVYGKVRLDVGDVVRVGDYEMVACEIGTEAEAA